MKVRTGSVIFFLLAGILAVAATGMAQAAVHDLTAEWSGATYTENNWTVRSADNPASTPFNWTDFDVPMNGWTYDPALPLVWFKSTADNPYCNGGGGYMDFLTGDVVTHGGYQPNYTNVIWTSNESGIADISGQLWLPRHIGRYMNWALYLSSTKLGDGAVTDTSSRAAPVSFSYNALNLAAGDVLQLILSQGTTVPDYVGVNLTIDVGPSAPLPTTSLLLGSGLLGLWGWRRGKF